MPNELELIKQLEKEIGRELKQAPLSEVKRGENSFALDDRNHVEGLTILTGKMDPFPVTLLKFQNLETLIIVGSNCSDISSFNQLKGLTLLNLGYNQISDISSFNQLKELTELYLGYNQISDISSLNQLKNLKILDLRYNKITHLPAELLDLGMEIKWERKTFNDEGIFLAGNLLESPPVEIVIQGDAAVREYFKSLEGEKQALNEVKVLLVGDGSAGKTSLVKRLRGETFDIKESQTHGININPWEITAGDKEIKVRLWDFGGQEIMHATHQFFLSKRSLYILVLDGRKDEKTEYWLNHIKIFGGDSPVLVVLNKMDENPGFDVNRRFLMGKYPNIKGFYKLSCATGKGIDSFKKELTRELAAVELLRTTWAKNWFNVKSRLEDMTENFINYDKYRDICTEANITTETAQNTLVDFLNDLGVILHFKDFELGDTHVLEPKWITNAVYKIINSELLSTCKGVLKLSMLDDILKPREKGDFTYPRDKYRYIIDLMKKFELCYTIDETRILIPDLLAVGEPEIRLDRTKALKFQFHYNFLPKSIMPRFIVKQHKDIKAELRWRTGVVLEDKRFDAIAVVKADERDQDIFVHVTGTQKRDYFAIIRKTFNDIHDSFEKLDVEELIPLPDNNKITVEYKELIGYEKAGKDEYFVGKLQKTYSVSQLLAGIEKPQDRKEKIIIEREIIERPSPPMVESKPEKPKKWHRILKIAAAIAGIIAFLAALFAILDSSSFQKFWEKLTGKDNASQTTTK